MIQILVSAYLSGLCLLAAAVVSCITVVPGGEKELAVVMGALLALAGGFAVASLGLWYHYRRHPHGWIFTSGKSRQLAYGIAILLTILLGVGVLG